MFRKYIKKQEIISQIIYALNGMTHCADCGAIYKKDAMQKVMVSKTWYINPVENYYCPQHVKPYDKITSVGEFFKSEVEVTEKGKIIKK